MNADEVIKNFKNAQLLLKFAFDPDQPRDENGKFASGGGDASKAGDAKDTMEKLSARDKVLKAEITGSLKETGIKAKWDGQNDFFEVAKGNGGASGVSDKLGKAGWKFEKMNHEGIISMTKGETQVLISQPELGGKVRITYHEKDAVKELPKPGQEGYKSEQLLGRKTFDAHYMPKEYFKP